MERQKSFQTRQARFADETRQKLQSSAKKLRLDDVDQEELIQQQLDEYEKTEIIRQAVGRVKEDAEKQRFRRLSPDKAYIDDTKSKVGGNLKT